MATEPESAGLASSLTDLMTSLAVIFILLLVAMLNNARQQAEGTRSQVLSRLLEALKAFQKAGAKEGVQITTDPKDPLGLLVIVPEGLLQFHQGKAEIPPGGTEFLQRFIPTFVQTACSPDLRQGISSIVVEGHASSEGAEKLNLALSQSRSMSVVQDSLDVLDNGTNGNSAENHTCFVGFVSATGRGSADPYKDKDGNEDRSLSRRVVFKIRVKSIEQRGFETRVGLSDVKPAGQ